MGACLKPLKAPSKKRVRSGVPMFGGSSFSGGSPDL